MRSLRVTVNGLKPRVDVRRVSIWPLAFTVGKRKDRWMTTCSLAWSTFGDLTWFEVFKDPKLQELIRIALKENYDVQIVAL
jgi:hypothetical protein